MSEVMPSQSPAETALSEGEPRDGCFSVCGGISPMLPIVRPFFPQTREKPKGTTVFRGEEERWSEREGIAPVAMAASKRSPRRRATPSSELARNDSIEAMAVSSLCGWMPFGFSAGKSCLKRVVGGIGNSPIQKSETELTSSLSLFFLVPSPYSPIACFSSLASWSEQEVVLGPQVMPERRLMTS